MSHWDTELMENQTKLGDLAINVRRLQMAEKELNANLDTISAYQMELDATLEQLETSVDRMFETHRQMPDFADIEREKTLQLSIDIDTQLHMMTSALNETMERLNQREDKDDDDGGSRRDLDGGSGTSSASTTQEILKILNVHHNSLLWIDQMATKLQEDMGSIAHALSVGRRKD